MNGNQRVNFAGFLVSYFAPYLFSRITYGKLGCGANALAMLTGHHPVAISEFNKDKTTWPDHVMLKYLKGCGFKVAKVGDNVLDRANGFYGTDALRPLRYNHVFLVAQKMNKIESTWTIWFDEKMFHNYEILDGLSYLEFATRPVRRMYVVFHKKWVLGNVSPTPVDERSIFEKKQLKRSSGLSVLARRARWYGFDL